MEYFKNPYSETELQDVTYKANMLFLEKLKKEILEHEVFDHPFLIKFAQNHYSFEGMKFILKQFGKIVMPFTAMICKLMGNAPDIKSRYILMDNLYEEMGSGDVNVAHPMLYLQMLNSIGVTKEDLLKTVTISTIRILNNAILDAVENKSFSVGCAWLGYGGELTIPNNFSYLKDGLKASHYAAADMGFLNRHGARDQDHSDDMTKILALNTTPAEHQNIQQAVIDSLNIRALIWAELEQICDVCYVNTKGVLPHVITGEEKEFYSDEHKVLSHYYNALNSGNIEQMKENWCQQDNATFVSPLGGVFCSYGNIIESHNQLFQSSIEIDVEYFDIEINQTEDGFFTVGRERGTMKVNDDLIPVNFRTSRIFIKVNGDYKQIHHHGSFEELSTQLKVVQTLVERIN